MPPHCPYFATAAPVELALLVVVLVSAVVVLVVLDEATELVPPGNIAGTEIVAIVHTFPPSEDANPVYVVPPDTLRVDPKVVSAAARVMTVFLYV
jgi:hypothetical protein